MWSVGIEKIVTRSRYHSSMKKKPPKRTTRERQIHIAKRWAEITGISSSQTLEENLPRAMKNPAPPFQSPPKP